MKDDILKITSNDKKDSDGKVTDTDIRVKVKRRQIKKRNKI